MAFDSTNFSSAPHAGTNDQRDAVATLCPVWTAENPDRALAILLVAPQDCDAVDVLTAH